MTKKIRTRRAVTATAVALAGMLAVTVPPAIASLGSTDVAATSAADQRQVAVDSAQQKAVELEQRRLRELAADGMTAEAAEATVAEEQRQAAAEIRLRIAELSAQGKTIDEIASATPGMVVASAPDKDDAAPRSSPDDITQDEASITFAQQCNCYSVNSGWERGVGLNEDGKEVVGIRLTEEVSDNMGGTAVYCRSSSNDSCTLQPDIAWEEPAGVAHSFSTWLGSHHGTIVFSYKGGVGSVQPYTHYNHAWTEVRINGVGISRDSISVSWEYDENAWNKQTAGDACDSC